jgi:uncharacterized membrane protein YbhN (UPF0104 family)
MRLSHVEAHLICLGLVTADFLARTLRLQYLVRGCGHRLTLRQSFTVNFLAEAGATLTPLRVGGEPARLAGMLSSGVPAAASFVAIAYEVITAWPVLVAIALWVFASFAPEWWRTTGVTLGERLWHAWEWVLVVALASAAAWWFGRRVARVAPHRLRRPVRRIAVYWRRMPWWPVAASVPLSAVNVLARVALLPVLALTLPDPPSLPTLIVGSFALTYSQLVLPTPGGAGPVELGFLAGAAGNLGGAGHWLLLWWRFYGNGLGTILGVLDAARLYGWPALRAVGARLVRGAPAA